MEVFFFPYFLRRRTSLNYVRQLRPLCLDVVPLRIYDFGEFRYFTEKTCAKGPFLYKDNIFVTHIAFAVGVVQSVYYLPRKIGSSFEPPVGEVPFSIPDSTGKAFY